MSELQPWVWTHCERCHFKGSARTIHALVEAMAEHDRYCERVDLHSDPAPVGMMPMK